MGAQVAVDFLADHVRAPGPQYLPGAAQVRLELGIPGLMFPALVVGLREQRRRRRRHPGDRGDQGDHLALAVAFTVGDLVLDHPDIAGLVLLQVLPVQSRPQPGQDDDRARRRKGGELPRSPPACGSRTCGHRTSSLNLGQLSLELADEVGDSSAEVSQC